MPTVQELLSQNISNAQTNVKTWGPLMYNALEHGVKGDWDGVKGTDDTEAMQKLVNKAIAEGRKCIGLPHTPTGGMYYVTHLDNADQVVFVGDNASFVGGFTGTINQLGTHGLEIEQGSWTPTLRGSTTAGKNTYSVQRGRYYRVGKQVTVSFMVSLSEKDNAMVGNVWISGLPFMVGDSDFGVSLSRYGNLSFPANRNQVIGRCVQNNNIIAFTASGDNIPSGNITVSNLTNSSEIHGTATYFIP